MGRPKGSKNKKKKTTKYEEYEQEYLEDEPSFLFEMKKEIMGIIIITVCVILGISVFYETDSGTLLGPIHAGLEYLFGWFAFVFPIIIIMYTVVVLSDEEKEFNFKFFFTLITILSIISAYPALFASGQDGFFLEGVKYGGYLGGAVAWCLYHIAGTLGGFIILVSISIVTFILLAKKSFFETVFEGASAAAEGVRNSKEKFESHFFTKDDEDYEVDYDEDEEIEDDEEYEDEEADDIDVNLNDGSIDEEDEDEEENDDEDSEELEENVGFSLTKKMWVKREAKDDEVRKVVDNSSKKESKENKESKNNKENKKEKRGLFGLGFKKKQDDPQHMVEILGSNETREELLKAYNSKNSGIVDIAFWEKQVQSLDEIEDEDENENEDDYEETSEEEYDEVDENVEDEEYEDEEEYEDDDETGDDDFDDDDEDDSDGFEENPKSHIVRTKDVKKKKRTYEEYDDEDDDEGDDEEQLEIEEEEEEIEYEFPSIKLLTKPVPKKLGNQKNELKQNAKILESTLQSFGVNAKVLDVTKGPAVTRYELQPERGVKVSKIVNLTDDIALNLAAAGVRIEAPIPGKAAIGIEIANKESTSVLLREVIDTPEFENAESKLSVCLGKGIDGKPAVIDLAKMPHLLIAGATGSGKSVCINSIITSIIYKANPNEVKLLMVDPKVVELKMYTGIPHLLIPVVTNPKKAASALNWAVSEMLERYKFFADNNVKDLKGYNALMEKQGKKKIPQIVIIIDELADLMMSCPKDVEDAICRLAQMARAAGMHLIIATQRPSVDVITGLIKANIPSRIAFAVSSQIDSRTILDISGAEKLLGKGDMLYFPVGANKPTRIQGAFVSESEVEKIVDFVKGDREIVYNEGMIEAITDRNLKDVASGSVDGEDGDESDDLLDDAIELVREKKKASITMFQRAFRIGYNRAARLMDELEDKGVVGPEEGTKPRKVLLESVKDDYD